jgi:hypothetical protein
MSVERCIACGKLVDLDTNLEDYNFDTLQCVECDQLDEDLGS